jgi:hypothetical protein
MKTQHPGFFVVSLVALGIAIAGCGKIQAGSPQWEGVADWLKLPKGLEQMGNAHGDVAVSSKGEVYVSLTAGLRAGVQVYGADGKYLRNLKGAPSDFHGFVIHKGADGEFLYGPTLTGKTILKMTLDGEVVMTIPGEAIPEEFWKVNPKNKQKGLRLTGCDVAPNGDIFVVDGYSSDYVHRFDAKGKYLASFGGREEPYGFKTLHKIAVDTRFDPPRIIATDRTNLRVVHMSLEGEFLGDVITDLLKPAAVVIYGDYAAIGEIGGRITVVDKEGSIVAQFGASDDASESGTNKTEPAKWRTGVVTAPHGVAFNSAGDLFVAEYSVFGRVHRYKLKK